MDMQTYCTSITKIPIEIEQEFLKNVKNSGKIAENYVKSILIEKNVKFIEHPRIQLHLNKYIIPDFYIPSKNLFIEVKSRTFNCQGTASEKMDNIPRKYSKLKQNVNYNDSKVLVVFCAGELHQKSTLELINYKNTGCGYIKDFVELSKKHCILDWITINQIHDFLT